MNVVGYDTRATESPKVVIGGAIPGRQYAMELGMSLRESAKDPEAASAFLLALIEELEAAKAQLGVSRDEGEQMLYALASEVFARADAEDRGAAGASKSTARTFYAASNFFDALKQFGERGQEADEKCRYAKWKAADILKAFKEGRAPTPGGPGGIAPADDDAAAPSKDDAVAPAGSGGDHDHEAAPATIAEDAPAAADLPSEPAAPPAYDQLPELRGGVAADGSARPAADARPPQSAAPTTPSVPTLPDAGGAPPPLVVHPA
eukprot:CAMPEP_0185694440 /NCGR_PEP_ID=MMETSP1164-20130828/3905_1 /TAXON_ID=1104430 /ORGANISM="Chrysoreinhardia sp, Strain CCMP2950" /LENGTH=262 /DNA_ID=CAMNT_0028361275 /DNA_START=100 /DNA_END=885 /DNA_ORIENTATION=-